jgi:eight-cysteine-cluster-containing protein
MRIALLLFLLACGSKGNPPSQPSAPDPAPAAGDCVKSGCSGTVCTEPGNEMVTTCEFKAEYACYRDAACERQADGNCGWTQTPALTACLANPPPIDGAGVPQ